MEKNSLKAYLSDRYQGWDSFCDTIVIPIFGKENYEDKRKKEVLDMQPERRRLADATGIRSVKFCGHTYVSGEPLQFFDITVCDKVMMDRNRVNVQKIIRSVMDQYSSAFMVFHYEDEAKWEWRFSFCYKSENEDESTDRKRYTFLLGPGQSCRTAAENFMALIDKHKKDDEVELIDIIHAFDIEALSDEFFDKYSEYYADFVEYVTGKRIELVNGEWKEVVKGEPHPQMYADFGYNDKAVRDYIKRTLGRIVFLHFLQKKGWMGVEPGKEWGTGDVQFMKHLYEAATDEQKDDFLDGVLEPLFDKALDTIPDNDEWIYDAGVRGLPNGGRLRFPYMNGGLFERDAYDRIPTKFPRKMFADFLEFLYEYNFTIDENDPNDAEVGVDPEMLGQIFENLLEDNKYKGAYYTRKEVVQYMAKEALIAYLQTDVDDDEKREAIRQLVARHEACEQLPQDISQRLKKVKVCDPAIGSGAYPMGLLKEIFRCRLAIENFPAERNADVKRHIIQQNIYGVDIEQGAVEIARLRFWLSLVVDELSPKALPNLDYKIVTGNSLLPTFDGHYVNIDVKENHLNASAISVKKRQLVELKNRYFLLNGQQKYQCEIDIKRIILDIVELQLCFERQNKTIKSYRTGNLFEENRDLSSLNEEEIARAIMPEQQELIDHVRLLHSMLYDINRPIKERAQITIPFFDWRIMFSEIFQEGGFDIVLGNPPYISTSNQLKDSTLTQQRENLKECNKYQTLIQSWDLFMPFIEGGIDLLKDRGIMTMIIPYRLADQKYAKKIRQFLCEDNQIIEIMDAKGYKLFKNATVENCIPLVRKGGRTSRITIAHYHDDKTITKDFVLPLDLMVSDKKSYLWNFTENIDVRKEYKGFLHFVDFCYLSEGMKLNADEQKAKGAFVKSDLISNTKDKIHTKEYIEGKDIERYVIKNESRYLEYGTDRVPGLIRRPTFPELYSSPKIMFNILGTMKCMYDGIGRYVHGTSILSAVLWKDLRKVKNKSINSSIKKHCHGQSRDVLEQNSEKITLLYLLGILNSAKANELLSDQRGGDYHIYPEHIRNIPIPIASKEMQEKIGELARQIMEMKSKIPSANTSTLESEIDSLVYQLYAAAEGEN